MTAATNPNPATGGEVMAGYDPSGHQSNVLIAAKNVQTDATTGLVYGDLGIQVDVATTTAGVGATGAAVPADAEYIAGNSGGNLVGIAVDSIGRQLIGVSTSALFTAAQTTVGSGNSGDLDVSKLREISIDITTTAQAGTNPTIQFFWERKGADGVYYKLWQSSVLTAASNTLSTSIGPGLAYTQSLGPTGRLEWVVGGSNTPTYTFTPNVYGK